MFALFLYLFFSSFHSYIHSLYSFIFSFIRCVEIKKKKKITYFDQISRQSMSTVSYMLIMWVNGNKSIIQDTLVFWIC